MLHYHFIAIGGAGMSGIARILVESGHGVSGSDIKASEATRRLSELGASVALGHRAENIPDDAEVIVVSSAIHPENPEVVEGKRRGLEILHRGDMLAWMMNQGKGIAVAGAHGKTTTTSMVAVMLERAGKDPTVLVGGEVSDFGGNAKLGHGSHIVAEADESDGSFLKLRPYIGVVTNIDDDHLDYYGDLDHVKQAFRTFMHERIREDGYLVYCADDANAAIVATGSPRNSISYGIGNNASIRAANISKVEWGVAFDVYELGQKLGHVILHVPGIHNVRNALAAISVGRLIGVEFEAMAEGLESFRGAQRRLQLTGKERGILVLDDYAHHPTEIRASLKAIRDQVGGKVHCVYQPHRYSRTLALKDEFGDAFIDCDHVYLTAIYAGPGEHPIEGVSSELIADAVSVRSGIKPAVYDSWDDLMDAVSRNSVPGDAIITMGAGDVYTMGPQILDRLRFS